MKYKPKRAFIATSIWRRIKGSSVLMTSRGLTHDSFPSCLTLVETLFFPKTFSSSGHFLCVPTADTACVAIAIE